MHTIVSAPVVLFRIILREWILIYSLKKFEEVNTDIKGGGGGGGGGVHPDYFVKLDFEIAVDQQTRARDRTFEGVPDSGWLPVPAGQPRPYLVNLWPTCI